MRSTQLLRNLRAVLVLFGDLEQSGTLEPEHAEAVRTAIHDLEHAVKVRDDRMMGVAINKLAMLFLANQGENGKNDNEA